MLPINKLMGKKRALLIAVRHVRGLPNFHTTGLADLSWTHRDAINLRGRLIASHGYEAKDVILMLDNQRHPEDLWPTRKNILREMRHLVSDAPEDSQFFLYYSGHGLQEECQDGEEADGKDEEIVAADGKPILDDLIHIRLITPLERVKGSKLFALFDCCHSETLLAAKRWTEHLLEGVDNRPWSSA
ncbi:peptidase C14 [Gyrodon lividus]|nr:peptidase C14 [Gyrodon lividus]